MIGETQLHILFCMKTVIKLFYIQTNLIDHKKLNRKIIHISSNKHYMKKPVVYF